MGWMQLTAMITSTCVWPALILTAAIMFRPGNSTRAERREVRKWERKQS